MKTQDQIIQEAYVGMLDESNVDKGEQYDRMIANKIVHPVESTRHYKTLSEYGFIPITRSHIGFNDKYTYSHPILGNIDVSDDNKGFAYVNRKTGKRDYFDNISKYIKGLSK